MSFALALSRQASELGLALSQTPEFIFRRRYSLPPTDRRFLDCTTEQVVLDVWAHAHTEDPKLRDQMVTQDFEAELAEAEAEQAAADALAVEALDGAGWDDVEEMPL